MKIEYPQLSDTPVSHLPFSPVVRVGNMLYVSGQASVDATGKIIPDTFEGEVRRSLDNLKKILENAGSDLRHVVKTTNYVREQSDLAKYQEIYKEYFQEPYPARTTVSNCLGQHIQYEVDCIAIVKDAADNA